MNRFGLKFHHFGLATKSADQAGLYLEALGYVKSAPMFDPLQSVNLAMFHHPDMPSVELIWPADAPSPVDSLIKLRDGLIYHLCYVAASPAAAVKAMEAAGLRVVPVAAAKAAILFGGNLVSFYHVENVGLIELIEGEPGRN